MSLVNMKMSAEEAKEETGLLGSDIADAPEYPYGLTLTLCDESMQKLGMATLPVVGTKMMITAMVTVTGTRANSTQGGDDEQSTDLQITDMQIGPAGAKSTADVLYGSES